MKFLLWVKYDLKGQGYLPYVDDSSELFRAKEHNIADRKCQDYIYVKGKHQSIM